ncbi:DUF7666 domain-containing protein [Pseudoclavibacter helvolus]|uniref:DUF7666 domain-containing protein n=1 Tax=Pseudoclavibacter helvolus TaxID=255205 RepID=UPI0035EB3FDC
MSTVIVTTQAELDAALAASGWSEVRIRAEKRLRLVVGPTGDHDVILEGGTVQRVLQGGTVQEVWQGGTVQRVWQGGTVQRVWQGGTVQRVLQGGTVQEVLQGGTVQEVWQGGTVQEVLQGGTVQRVLQGGTVQRVWQGGTVQEVLQGGTVQEVLQGGTVQEVWQGGTVQEVLQGGTVQDLRGASIVLRAESGATIAKAGPWATIYVYGADVTVDGGRIIDLSGVNEEDAETWCEFQGVTVEDGHALLYKAVNDDLKSERLFAYPVGETVICLDWTDDNECGGGLHVSPTPGTAHSYFERATRFLEVKVPLAELRPILGRVPKAKFRTGVVLREVTRDGGEVKA